MKELFYRIYYYQYRYLWRQIFIWPWQRVVRGWDDRASWSVDYWLADIMPAILTQLKNDKQGIPSSFCYTRPYTKDEDWAIYEQECEVDLEIAENIFFSEEINGLPFFNIEM